MAFPKHLNLVKNHTIWSTIVQTLQALSSACCPTLLQDAYIDPIGFLALTTKVHIARDCAVMYMYHMCNAMSEAFSMKQE